MSHLRIKISNTLTWFLAHAMKLGYNLKPLSKISSVVALSQHVLNIFGIVKIAKSNTDGDDTSVGEPIDNPVVYTFPCSEASRESCRCLCYSSNGLRFFARNILPKTMSFEPPTHVLRPSRVIGAIKNDGDRLGNVFGIWESGKS
jgi:hypothetical protein